MAEAWKAKGGRCDEEFFMHFDVLYRYRFLQQVDNAEKMLSLEQLLDIGADHDTLISVTDAGREFLHGFGGR